MARGGTHFKKRIQFSRPPFRRGRSWPGLVLVYLPPIGLAIGDMRRDKAATGRTAGYAARGEAFQCGYLKARRLGDVK